MLILKMALVLHVCVILCAILGNGAGFPTITEYVKNDVGRQIGDNTDGDRTPGNIRIVPEEESLEIHWTPPRDVSSANLCAIEYKDQPLRINEPRMIYSLTVPIQSQQTSYEIAGLQPNRLYKIRLFCFYGSAKGPSTDWVFASTRSTSVENNICTGRLQNAYLSPDCLKRPSSQVCEYRCINGYRKLDFASSRLYIRPLGDETIYIRCENGTWKTGFEKYGHRLEDICSPEAVFHKCPLSIPNGKLEGHCGPTLDWLCNFECNEGYSRHPYMTGKIKGYYNDPEKLLCGEDGVWRTGYENIGLNVSGLCFGSAADENCTDDLPNGYVYHKPVKSGHSHGMRCLDGFLSKTLDDTDRATCVNGTWVIRATKYDASINPQTVCLRSDTVRNCPRNIQNGRVPDDCTVNCKPECEDGYHVFGEDGLSRAPDSITCENGKWLTESLPYTGDNICVSSHGMVCSDEIPNGKITGPEYLLRDVDRGRRYWSFDCNPDYRHHRSITHIECIAGNWVTWNERFGIGVSELCIPETDP